MTDRAIGTIPPNDSKSDNPKLFETIIGSDKKAEDIVTSLTLKDVFAALLIPAALTKINPTLASEQDYIGTIERAYQLADIMLQYRNKS